MQQIKLHSKPAKKEHLFLQKLQEPKLNLVHLLRLPQPQQFQLSRRQQLKKLCPQSLEMFFDYELLSYII